MSKNKIFDDKKIQKLKDENLELKKNNMILAGELVNNEGILDMYSSMDEELRYQIDSKEKMNVFINSENEMLHGRIEALKSQLNEKEDIIANEKVKTEELEKKSCDLEEKLKRNMDEESTRHAKMEKDHQNIIETMKDKFTKEEIKHKDPAAYYINYDFEIGNIDNYKVESKIGRGRYSDVYQGLNIKSNEKENTQSLADRNFDCQYGGNIKFCFQCRYYRRGCRPFNCR